MTLSEWHSRLSPFARLGFDPDRYETFAYASESRTRALGAQSVSGVFAGTLNSQVNMNEQFGFTRAQWDHSAQFNGTNMVRRLYWNEILVRMGLKQ